MTPLFVVNTQSAAVKRSGSYLEQTPDVSDDHTLMISDFAETAMIPERLNKIGADHLVIEGGDGTAQGVLTVLLRHKHLLDRVPRIILLAGGNTNQVARNVGIRRISRRRLNRLIKGAEPRQHTVPMLSVSVAGGETCYGFLFSTGALPQVTDYTKDTLHKRGVGGGTAVAAAILKAVSGSRKNRDKLITPTDMTLTIDGNQALSGPHLGTIVTSLPGLMFYLDPFYGDGPGALRLFYADSEIGALLPHVGALILQNQNTLRKDPHVTCLRADRLDYQYDGPAVLDGEVIALPQQSISVSTTAPLTFLS